MKRNIVNKVLLSVVFVLASILVKAQIPDELVLSLKTGNASGLASYFNQNIELFVLDSDDVYSRAQAEQIVSNFFNQNKASDFTIIHQSGKEDTKYAIGKLSTNNGVFRVSFLMKNDNSKPVIHQLRIEKQ